MLPQAEKMRFLRFLKCYRVTAMLPLSVTLETRSRLYYNMVVYRVTVNIV